jgi:hypothetical protein
VESFAGVVDLIGNKLAKGPFFIHLDAEWKLIKPNLRENVPAG